MHSFSNEQTFASHIQQAGGHLYRVGGSVRDALLGTPSHDEDYCVTGFDRESFQLAFPFAKQVLGAKGEKTVDVFLVSVRGEEVEVALAREEIKTGVGYHGFEFISKRETTIEKDLERRDLTINAIAQSVLTGEIIDPFGGVRDIENRVLRAVSDAFYEDALRVYRVAVRYAKNDGFIVEERTKEMMKRASKELHLIHPSRVVEEIKKVFTSEKPDKFFRLLAELDVLAIHFSHVDSLRGVEQPFIHHPEGDAFEHTMRTLRAMRKMTDRFELLYCMLVHDLGKGLTPKEKWPAHHGHEGAGVPLVQEMSDALKVPNAWKKAALFATEYHGHFHVLGEMKAKKVVDILLGAERTPLKVEGLVQVALADARGKNDPQASHPYANYALEAKQEMLAVKGDTLLTGKAAGEDKRRRQAQAVHDVKKRLLLKQVN